MYALGCGLRYERFAITRAPELLRANPIERRARERHGGLLLTKVVRLDSAALAEVRDEARKLEERGYDAKRALWTIGAIEAEVRTFSVFSARGGHDSAS